MALAVFRLRGAYFAVGTWVLAETLQLAVSLIKPLGAGSGMTLTPAIVRADRARPRGARDHRLLDLAGDRDRSVRHRLFVAALASMGWR